MLNGGEKRVYKYVYRLKRFRSFWFERDSFIY